MPRQKYALVKWIGKKYNNTYTPNVPLEWILGFDEKDSIKNRCKDDKGYVIQWRDTRECPENGWNCYDGIVCKISTRQKELEDHMKNLTLTLSPKFILKNKDSPKFSHLPQCDPESKSRSRSRSHYYSKDRNHGLSYRC